MKTFLLFLFILLSYGSTHSQTDSYFQVKKLTQLKKKVRQELKGLDVRIKNVRYRGTRRAIGEFWSSSPDFPIPHGIILTTGRAADAAQENNDEGKTSTNFNKGERDLKKLTADKIYDASVLQFDFYPSADYVSFNFMFGSEAYPEFINSNYNDILAFVLTFPNGTKVNFAKVPHSPNVISVNHINHEVFPEYYINNCNLDASTNTVISDTIIKITSTHKIVLVKWPNIIKARLKSSTYPIQYDGFTKVLKAQIGVRKNKKHHLKIIIADNSNRIFDSAVFIEMGSFHSHNDKDFNAGILATTPNYYYTIDTVSITKLDFSSMEKKSSEITICIRHYPDILFDYDSPQLQKSSAAALKSIAHHLKKCPHLMVKINGYAAAKDDDIYNQKLSKERSERVRAYLVKYGVPDHKIEVKWHGNNDAKTNKDLANNRRVKLKIVAQ
jgi:outer membrane protein OmpA-like peptidoglycan-associated protein